MAVRIFPWLMLPLLASCVAPSTPAPTPTPAPSPTPPPAALPAPAAAPSERYAGDWTTDDATPGDWRYADRVARFGGSDGAMIAELACSGGTLTLTRTGSVPADIAVTMTLRTSFGERRLPVRSAAQRRLATPLPATDPLWDQIIYSRGRFVIEATRQPPLILPNPPEVARVIEDCRG